MSYLAGDQVKRVQRLVETLDQKVAEALTAQEDMNSLTLKRDKARQAVEQARQQLAVELVKMDPGIVTAVSARFEPGTGTKKAS